ncbi:MAG: FG-GAP-like repeat-containing protein [Flavobacteriales bacterium]
MNKIVTLFCVALGISSLTQAQTFTDASSELPNAFNSGGCVAVTDMNGDGLDDILTLDQSTDVKVYYQNLNGTPGFTLKEFGSVSTANQWGMAVADINNDGHKDVFSGGNFDGVHYCQIIDPDNFQMFDYNDQLFTQGTNLADINNDGWLDAFGCNDVGHSVIWANDTDGNLEDADWIDMTTTPASDNSGNYGTVWSDFDNDNDLDLFIAKCRQNVSNPLDPRRINAAFVNDGSSNYTDEAGDRGLIIYEQCWTVDFADIDNDGDFDCLLTNHSTTMSLLENDGKGHFTDITAGSGLEVLGFFLQAKMSDFDNDGYVDLITSGGDFQATSAGFYKNNGDGTFTDLGINSILPSFDMLHSFGIGDLNSDGWLDIYASYGDTYVNPDFNNDDRLWMNDGGDNNWIGFDLEGVVSNKDAIGAKIQIYGDFGTQIREIRSGESYGITNSNMVTFGLGTFTSVDYAVIRWPSGISQVIENAPIGEYHFIEESDCNAPEITASASSETICEGSTAIMSVDGDGVVLWSNGMVGNDVEVTEGNHSAVVLNNGCASMTNTVCVLEIEDVDPTIEISGETDFCEGESVTLQAPDAEGYEWSNNATSQSIEVSESGDYSVTVTGACQGDVQSETITVTVLELPADSPVAADIEADAGMVELTATGDNLIWFSDAEGTNELGEGNTITTELNVSTTVYVASQTIYGDIETVNGSKESRTDDSGAHHDNSNNGLVFDAFQDMVIKDVKVYANGAGDRTITVRDGSGIEIISETFNLPDGESVVNLEFFIPEGEDYVMVTADNNPQLWRDALDDNIIYPYILGDLGAVTGTTINGQNEFTYYYFFYDWNVENPTISCLSDLVPVMVTIVGVEELEGVAAFSIYPNPASTEIRYEYSIIQSGDLTLTLSDNQGREVYNLELDANNGDHQGVIDLTGFAPGLYTFTIMENGKLASQKIVIE